MWKSKTTIGFLLLLSLPSCAGINTMGSSDNGEIAIYADALGMAELSNLLAAQAQIAKDSPDSKGPSWSLREQQETTRQLRLTFKKRGAK